MKRTAALVFAAALAVVVAMVSRDGKKQPEEVRVFAASSLTDVMTTIARDFERETGTKVVLNFAASSTLARQIVQGAPCDVFLSADQEWADFVENSGLSEQGSRWGLLTNKLVVVRGRPATEAAFELRGGSWPGLSIREECKWIFRADDASRIAVADPSHVPAGRYAKQALIRFGVWEEVQPRLIPCDTVRDALALVERGEADLGIVYNSDAVSSRRVETVLDFGWEGTGARIRYPVLELRGCSPSGRGFVRALGSQRSWSEFSKAGFWVVGQRR